MSFFNQDIAQVHFEYKKFGKPYLKGNDISFNISHSKNLAIIALSKNRLLLELDSGREFEEGSSLQTASYSRVGEDLSLDSLSKLPSRVEFKKKSNIEIG